jgi:hypothetical protein
MGKLRRTFAGAASFRRPKLRHRFSRPLSGPRPANQIVAALVWVVVFLRGSRPLTRRRLISVVLAEYCQQGVPIPGRKKVLPVTRTYFFLSFFFQ